MSRRRLVDDRTRSRVIAMLAEPGASVRKVAAAVGVSGTTVHRIRNAPEHMVVVDAETGQSMPFGRGPQSPAHIPPASWDADQPPPPPAQIVVDPAYHGHTFRAFGAPLAFEGWTIERIRNAIAQHDQGNFIESSSLAIAITRFAPVHAALAQAMAPSLALPRHVLGGTRGLARVVRDEVEAQLAPRSGLMPSRYFPPALWGAMDFDLMQMGFSCLQHVVAYEPEFYDTMSDSWVFPIYTRRWPTWAMQYYRYRRTFVALTTEGPIDIVSGDGKFTIVADAEEPHFGGAVRPAALEVLAGLQAKQGRNSYIDRYSTPKWVAIMPPKTGTKSDEGRAFFAAMAVIQGPNGYGALPYGSEVKTIALDAKASGVFKDALLEIMQNVAMIYVGSDGTMIKGAGVYSAPMFAGVRRDIIDRKLKAQTRGVNMGHVRSYLDCNYSSSIANAPGWVDPVVDIPLPDPDADERMKSYGDRVGKLHALVDGERRAGCVVDQDRVNVLAEQLEVEPPKLAEMTGAALTLESREASKVVTVDEARAAQKLPPIGDERGQLTIAELESGTETAPAEAPKEEQAA